MPMAEATLARLLLDAFRAQGSETEAALRDRGLEFRPSHAFALLLVDRSGTRLTELAERARITKQAMMQTVDELVALGLLRRTPEPQDGRAKIVRLTAKGLRQRAEARRAVASVETRARRHLGERRYEQLRAWLVELSSAPE
jgi:DNA-binding MarR family transcriptional regulator